MDIVDAQIHIGPGRIEEALAGMNALGIRSVLIDRFSYLVRLDRTDRDVTTIIRMARDAPHARALRITPSMKRTEAEAFATGEYSQICAAACECGLPLFMFVPGRVRDVALYAREFPTLRIIVDHCGLVSNLMRQAIERGGQPISRDAQLVAFDQVLSLADFPNVALKWAHAPAMFQAPGYPGEELRPILRKALDHFGKERIMWASDVSANQSGESWAMLLFGMMGNPDLSSLEREALLGGTIRAWLDWPAPLV
jgi:L-fuconolactonase